MVGFYIVFCLAFLNNQGLPVAHTILVLSKK